MGKAIGPVFIVMSVGLVVLLQFGFIFLMLAMLPSCVAFFIDRDKGRPTFKTVTACNFAAIVPSAAPMFQAAMHLRHYDVSVLMGDPSVWLFILSGAGAGWCLIYLCRFIARFVVTLMYEYNIVSLENFQKRLIEEWGQQIKQPPV